MTTPPTGREEMPEDVQAEVTLARGWGHTDEEKVIVWLADSRDRLQQELAAERQNSIDTFAACTAALDAKEDERAEWQRTSDAFADDVCRYINEILGLRAALDKAQREREELRQALSWALDIMDMSDKRLAERDGDAKVYSPTHMAGKAKARKALAAHPIPESDRASQSTSGVKE